MTKYAKFTEKLLLSPDTYTYRALILAPDIGQRPAKNRFMSDESCFTKDTAVRREIKKK